MKIFVFGSSITSSYWNGAATYYRGMYKALAALGHEVTFAEPDIYDRQKHRDAADVGYVEVLVYQTPRDIDHMLRIASDCDLIVKHSGVGAQDELLDRAVLECGTSGGLVAYWDVDAPATLARVERDRSDPFRALVPEYDFVFTYGGGPPVVEHYLSLGAANCYPIYNALDPDTHHPVKPDESFSCDLAFVGHRLPDRERRVEKFFLRAAKIAPEMSFVLGGEGWGGKQLPNNVRWIGHVGTKDHNRVNCSARMVLNVNRDSMAEVGFSPPTRVFEAAGAGACMITDAWTGVEQFFEPSKEILVASSPEHIAMFLRETSEQHAKQVGEAMRRRALHDHTYALRAEAVHRIVCERQAAPSTASAQLPVRGLR